MERKVTKIGIDARLWSETGVGRYIRNLVQNLHQNDTQTTYVLFILDKDFPLISEVITRPNWILKRVSIRWHSFAEQLVFPIILYSTNCDLIHFPYFSVPILYKKSYVVTIHDLIINHFPTGQASTLPGWYYKIKLRAYLLLLKRIAKTAKKIITVSLATKKEIEEHLLVSPDKIIVTYEGVDKHIVVTDTTVPFKNPYFLYVGNAYPHKNLPRLLQAFKKFKDKDTKDYILIFVGKEDFFYKRLKRLVLDMKLDQSVRFLHQVSDSDLAGLYEHAFAVVVPSLMEGFGLPALEALAHSCLVIASKTAALEEVCGDAVFYMDPLDVNDMAEKMAHVSVLPAPEMTKKKKIGLIQAKKFSWEKMTQETEAIYESCTRI